jgi:hypothetical protein
MNFPACNGEGQKRRALASKNRNVCPVSVRRSIGSHSPVDNSRNERLLPAQSWATRAGPRELGPESCTPRAAPTRATLDGGRFALWTWRQHNSHGAVRDDVTGSRSNRLRVYRR